MAHCKPFLMIDHFWLPFYIFFSYFSNILTCVSVCAACPFLASHYAFFNLALHLEEIAFFGWQNIKSAKFNLNQRRKTS